MHIFADSDFELYMPFLLEVKISVAELETFHYFLQLRLLQQYIKDKGPGMGWEVMNC